MQHSSIYILNLKLFSWIIYYVKEIKKKDFFLIISTTAIVLFS